MEAHVEVMVMKTRSSKLNWFCRKAIASCALALGIASLPLVAGAAGETPVTLKAGETYLIKDINKNSTPEVRFIKSPGSFSVASTAPGELQVLGVENGEGSIKVKRGDDTTTYHVFVSALKNVTASKDPDKA